MKEEEEEEVEEEEEEEECASIGSGFGELVFLSFTAHYDRRSVSGWSSGTGT